MNKQLNIIGFSNTRSLFEVIKIIELLRLLLCGKSLLILFTFNTENLHLVCILRIKGSESETTIDVFFVNEY